MKKLVTGILAHVDSGKTTLSEALLYCAGVLKKPGRVDHGDSFLDTEALERQRGITIFSKQAILRYEDTEVTLLDTPGHADFSAETERTLQVLDYAILVISGTDGVQSHTLTLWKLLKKYRVPCFIFVNKMDLPGADRELLLQQLRESLHEGCVDFTSPGETSFFESLAECDDVLLEQYAMTDRLSDEDIILAIGRRRVVPCMFGSALRIEGVAEFLRVLCRFTAMPSYGSDFAGKVFKLTEDRQGRKLTFLKVTGGTLQVRDVLKSEKNVSGEKVSQIRLYSGEKFTTADEVTAGTVCAVTGISFASCGDGLGTEENTPQPVLTPVLTYSVELPSGTDPHTALEKLRVLENEDPLLDISWNQRFGRIQLHVMGEVQLEILRSEIARRFGFEVSFGTGSIIYKETITEAVEGVGHFEPLRHYAEVHLLLRPGKRGSGLVFRSECREDQLDKNWQRLILSQLYESSHVGVLTGSPLTDTEIILLSGRAHPKHTEGGDFRQAALRAVRQGLRSAGAVLLEPYYEFTLEVPGENVGRAIGDIQRMSGTFEQPETLPGSMTRLTGRAPVSELNPYARELVQYTRGKGRLSCQFGGYEVCHDPETVIASFDYDPERDTDHPCDSVFCSHGSGFIVKWNDVPRYMHLPFAFSRQEEPVIQQPEARLSSYRSREDLFSLDRELMAIFERTYGPVRHRRAGESRTLPVSPSKPASRPAGNTFNGKEYVLVDGYNVIFSWDHLKKLALDNVDAARSALVNTLCNYQGFKKCELILVFDAYRLRGHPEEVERVGNISIVYTKEAETADMYIEKVTHQLARDHHVRVVTSDGLEQIIILGSGALRVSSRAFLEEVREAENEIRELIGKHQTT